MTQNAAEKCTSWEFEEFIYSESDGMGDLAWEFKLSLERIPMGRLFKRRDEETWWFEFVVNPGSYYERVPSELEFRSADFFAFAVDCAKDELKTLLQGD